MMILKLAWKNIWRNRRRTYITISAIAFAVLFAVAMRSMQQGMEEQMVKTAVENNLGYIQVHSDGYWDDKLLENGMFSDDISISKVGAVISSSSPQLLSVKSVSVSSFASHVSASLR